VGTVISTLFAAVLATSAYFLGSLSRLYFTGATVPKIGNNINYDAIMPNLFTLILSGGFGNFMIAVIVALVLSASMSTLASVVMTSSSAISIDLFDKKGGFAQKHRLSSLRILCVIFILISLVIALMKPAIIIDMMSFSWGTVAGSFIGPYFWGLYMKKAGKIGALSGLTVGFLISFAGIVVKLFIPNVTTVGLIESIRAVPAPALGSLAMIASFAVTPIVSLLSDLQKLKKQNFAKQNSI
jgi:Na+(H+)/acetate symporter ActP